MSLGNISDQKIQHENLQDMERACGSPLKCGITTVMCVSSLALFIIACVAAAGVYSGNGVGYAVIGLSGGIFGLNLLLGDLKKRKVEVIVGALYAAAIIGFASLKVANLLSVRQLGLGMLGTSLTFSVVNCCINKKKISHSFNAGKKASAAFENF